MDFLLDAGASDAVHEALLAAGARCVHRSADAANYAATLPSLAPVDLLYARRDRALEMLRGARPRMLRGARIRVPVVDAEALTGLVGVAVPDQARVRPPTRARDLDEFLRFLGWIEATFGAVARPVQPTTGDRFLL